MGIQRRRLDAIAQVEKDAGEIFDRQLLVEDELPGEKKVYLRRVSWPVRHEDQDLLIKEITELLQGCGMSNVEFCDRRGKTLLVYAIYTTPSDSFDQEADESAA